MDEVETLLRKAAEMSAAGILAREARDEAGAAGYLSAAMRFAAHAVSLPRNADRATPRLEVLQAAARVALDCGEVAEARKLIDEALGCDASAGRREEWVKLREVGAWPDSWLVAAVRQDPPDAPALDELVDRHWKTLFGRCRLLTLGSQKANDLAQETWCRVLRARHTLNPGKSFPGYLVTIATNIWRDWRRAARRAGRVADHRMASLDAAIPGEDGDSITLASVLPDLNAMAAAEQKQLMLDLDQALGRMTPHLREVLVARFLAGESCAEIGDRLGRTEQTISGWVRQAIHQVQLQFSVAARGVASGDTK